MKRAPQSSARPTFGWLAGTLFAFAAALAPAVAQTAAASSQQLGIPSIKGALIQPDTILHAVGGIMAGMFAASAASALSNTATLNRYPLFLPAVGFSAALTAGIAKETLDATGFGDPQWSDLFHTVIGGLLVAGMIAAVELSPDSRSYRAQSGIYALTGTGLAIPIGAALADEVNIYLAKRRLEK